MGDVSVVIKGGLGNQMFQIATAYAYAQTNNRRLLIQKEKNNDDGRATYWDSYLVNIHPYLVEKYNEPYHTLYEKPGRECMYDPLPIIPDVSIPILLEGFYQTSKYFQACQDAIRDLFQPPKQLYDLVGKKYQTLLEQKERVVVVHARRTDYLKSEWNISFHGPLNASYYAEAMAYICTKISNPIFVLFSDDPMMFWIQNLQAMPSLMTHPFHIIQDASDVETLTLMQQFHYYILANSTFSWWGAWLAKDQRCVCVPEKWFGPTGPQQYVDIYEPHWIKIPIS